MGKRELFFKERDRRKMQSDIQKALSETTKPRKKVFLGLPRLTYESGFQGRRIMELAQNRGVQLEIGWANYKMHHDYARNSLARDFMGSHSEWMLMIDADVEPNPALFELLEYDKPIISATVFCFQKGELMPSIWIRSECEECVAVKEFQEKGLITDPSIYRVKAEDPTWLYRWNPFKNQWQKFYEREFKAPSLYCRCRGTGKDPWVYKVHPSITRDEHPIEVDAVGAAALFIHRSIFEKLSFPWFSFLYREDRSWITTEDLFFCWKAKEEGFSIWADQTMFCGHVKAIDLLQVHGFVNKVLERQAEAQEKKIIVPTAADIARVN